MNFAFDRPLFFIASNLQLEEHQTTTTYIPTTTLVKKGVYTLSRNPMYVGFVTLLLAFCVLVDSNLAYVFPLLLFAILDTYFIPFEEKKMEKEIGQAYLDYKKQVRRWL